MAFSTKPPTPYAVPPLDAAVGAELASRLLGATEQLQRDAAIAAAVAAMRAARLARPLLDEAMDDLVRGRYGGTRREQVETLELELDERAWAIQSELDNGGGGDAAESAHAFRRARAAGAVKMALDANPRTAVTETVYEAAQAVDSRERFGQLLAAVLDLVEPGNHWAARDLAGLFWPRFVEVDGYVLIADHFEPDTFSEFRDQRPDSRPAVEDMMNHVHVQEVAGPNARPEAVGLACRHITQAWRDALDATLPEHEITVDWDPQERIVTAFSHAVG
jgi:hypothetical protein